MANVYACRRTSLFYCYHIVGTSNTEKFQYKIRIFYGRRVRSSRKFANVWNITPAATGRYNLLYIHMSTHIKVFLRIHPFAIPVYSYIIIRYTEIVLSRRFERWNVVASRDCVFAFSVSSTRLPTEIHALTHLVLCSSSCRLM